MSIAAAENAGLGPCELPLSDSWVSRAHAQITQNPIAATHHPHHEQQLQQQSSGIAALSTLTSPNSGGPSSGIVNYNTSSLIHLHRPQSSLQSNSQQIQSPAKSMNAVASVVASCPTAANKKIRRKAENKPQSQINKCNNEKRRRELENEYIEQLGEFLQINKRDMTSTKPDKAAILNDVVKKFREIIENRNGDLTSARCKKCPPNCADSCTVHPVQQGEVSSTEPPLPIPSVNGQNPEISAYFEAVEHYISSAGWVLLELNADGIIETVTANIKDLIRYTRSELQRQTIYSYLHPGDHSILSPILNNMSLALGTWEQDDGQQSKRSIKSKIRMLVKHSDGATETVEQKQQRQDTYKEVVIIAAPVKDDGDDSSSVLCLITRPEEENQIETTMPQRNQEEFTVKQSRSGAILQLDTSQLRVLYAEQLTKESSIQDLCHMQDQHKMQAHLTEVVQMTAAHSAPYRLRLGGPDVYVHVKAHSRLFPNTTANGSDFIMSVYSILSDNDVSTLECHNNIHSVGVAHSLPSTSHVASASMHHLTSSSSMGGPLMTSVMNGTMASVPGSRNLVSSPDDPIMYSNEEFDYDALAQGYQDIESVGGSWDPDSGKNITPMTTPRPPSASAYSTSPLTPYHSVNANQPSPSNNNNNNNNLNNNLNNNVGYGGFPFVAFEDKEQKEPNHLQMPHQQHQQLQQQTQMLQTQQHNHDSERLRNLLTKRPNSNASSSGRDGSDNEQRSNNQILKGLLNADEDKDGSVYSKTNASPARLTQHRQRSIDSSNGNNMLLHLLNDKSDDDDPEMRSKRAKVQAPELLRQLQKDDTNKVPSNTSQMGNDELVQMLKIDLTQTRKRPSIDMDGNMGSSAAKRPDNRPSKLCEKNVMLAKLLSNPSKAPSSVGQSPMQVKIIPDIPSSTISRVSSSTQMQQQSQLNSNNQQQQQLTPPHLTNTQKNVTNNQLQINQLAARSIPQQNVRKVTDSYQINQSLVHSQVMQPPAALRLHSFEGGFQFSSSNTLLHNRNIGSDVDSELSDILNDVIDIVPDGNFTGNDLNMLGIDSANNVAPTQAISAIQKDLMQIEMVVNNPPAYPMHGMQAQQTQQTQSSSNQGFPPPPIYQQHSIRNPAINNNPAAMRRQQYPHRDRYQQQQQHQQQQKERLLQQQQKQGVVVGSQPGTDQICLNPGISNIDALINNTVAPNVSLTRTAPDSQLSPGFPSSLMQQQLSPNQRGQPFSPQPNQGYSQYNGQRMSPQQQQQQQQMNHQQQQMAFQGGTNTSNNPQLSPRQPLFPQSQQSQSQQTQQQQNSAQPNQPQSSQQQNASNAQQWNTSSAVRLTLQQQQNPMLNAQLQGASNYSTSRTFQQGHRQRSVQNTSMNRQNSFTGGGNNSGGTNVGQDGIQFSSPTSPNQNYSSPIVFNQQQMRMQRQTSAPQATQHLPGSPRPYGPDTTGFSMMFNHLSQLPVGAQNDFYGRAQTGGSAGGMNSSDFVRQEVRALVSTRSQQQQQQQTGGLRPTQSPLGMGPVSMVGATLQNPNSGTSNTMSMTGSSLQQQQSIPAATQQQSTAIQMSGAPLLNSTPDPTLGFNFDINHSGEFFGGTTTR